LSQLWGDVLWGDVFREKGPVVQSRFAMLPLVCCACWLGSAQALRGQALQLPTFQFFTTETSVLVPDQGTASLGGVGRSSTGSNQFGSPFFPGTRSFGSQTSAGRVSVTAQIHDFEAADAALLGPLARNQGLGPAAAELAGRGPLREAQEPLASVAELAARKAASQVSQHAEAEELLKRSRKAQAEGKAGAAKIYLQMAAKRATGQLRQDILAELAASTPPPKSRFATRPGSEPAENAKPGPVAR
jgi:hypothetical protein